MPCTVSVAMAVYNGEKYLSQQIISILDQLTGDDELIISYDKSTDDTLKIIHEFASKDDRIRIILNDNPGIVNNFNNAIETCKNDIIFISDQDDIWVPGKREKMVEILNCTGADLAIHNVVHIDENCKIISRPLFEEYRIKKGILRNFAMPRYSGCCMAFPAASKKMIFPMPRTVINYDHWIGMVCELFGTVTFVEDVLLWHRLHGDNVTTSRRPLKVILLQRINLLKELIKRRYEILK
ncbi:glycosyltransferase [Bifidobacterium eulemuris]|uniref:Glycosyltransferase n=1 Tax=Bifidobacterium eulemuris TaxID=1765219 RepID=A0A261FXJ4_9BIFI|nr:glycosyltransferase [Bifidobacterium eulemuris]OZG63901.1 glycosyltransferase [Bifidobacterium eulemuris]QOL32428.1 glycosyltransferase [Bifidobacterium eulemuris]